MRNRVGGRVVDRLGSNLTKVAAVTQFILPGLPAMFAGDEIGASYEPYSELTTVPWRQIRAQTVLRAFVRVPAPAEPKWGCGLWVDTQAPRCRSR